MELSRVSAGSDVKVMRDDGQLFHFLLVAPAQADVGQGKLSVASPLGRSLLGKEPGQEFVYETPGGAVKMRVLEVVPPPA